jgi:hypothetical protein
MKLAVIGSNPPYIREGHYASGKCADMNKILASYIHDYRSEKELVCATVLKPGIDMIFAYLAVEEKLPLFIVIPYLGFSDRWSTMDKNLYREMLGYNRIESIVLNQGFTEKEKLLSASLYLINKSDVALVIAGEQDRTYYRHHANISNKEVITISDL